MDCGKVVALLSPYLDGELEPSEKDFISAHLNACPACRRELAELRAAVGVFRLLPELAPGPAFLPRLKERLAKESRSLPAGGGEHGFSAAPAGSPQGGRTPSGGSLRLPGAAAPAGSSGEGRPAPQRENPRRGHPRRDVSRRAGRQAILGLFSLGAGLWPKLAVAAVLLLAVGITCFWSGLAGPGLLPKLPVSQLAGQAPPQSKGEDARSGRADSAPVFEKKITDDAGRLTEGKSEGGAGSFDLFALAPQGTPAADQAPGAGADADKKEPAATGRVLASPMKIKAAPRPAADNQKADAGQQKIFLTASPELAVSAPAPGTEPAAARAKENQAVPGTAPGEEKPPATAAGQEKTKDLAGAGGIAAGKAAEPAAPAKKLARRMKIELAAGADDRKLSGLLTQFARPEEKPAAAVPDAASSPGAGATASGPAAADPGTALNSLQVRVDGARMAEFLAQLKLHGQVLRQEETSRDISADYARLKTELGQKQAQADDLQRAILALNKNSRGAREQVDVTPLEEELKKVQLEIQAIQAEMQRKNEELKTVAVEIYWRK